MSRRRLAASGPRTFTSAWLSWRPRVCLFHGFLSADEAAALIALADRQEACATHSAGAARTSSGCWLPRCDAPAHLWRSADERLLVTSVEERISHATGIPLPHGEPSQILRYARGQRYTLHPDFFDPKDACELANGGNRQATMLIYLSSLAHADGGATHFPRAELRVQPRCGDALLWWNTRCDGRVDPSSAHAGEEVVSSTSKWVLSKWLRQRPFQVDFGSWNEPGRRRARRRREPSRA